jgi:hypothetical protein
MQEPEITYGVSYGEKKKEEPAIEKKDEIIAEKIIKPKISFREKIRNLVFKFKKTALVVGSLVYVFLALGLSSSLGWYWLFGYFMLLFVLLLAPMMVLISKKPEKGMTDEENRQLLDISKKVYDAGELPFSVVSLARLDDNMESRAVPKPKDGKLKAKNKRKR